MNEIERRFGWRLLEIVKLVEKSSYEDAFDEYSNLVRLFSRLDGYDKNERIDFYKKIRFVGDDLLFKLAKKAIKGKVKEHKFSISEFKKKLKELKEKNLDEDICSLIKEEKFEEALKKLYENK